MTIPRLRFILLTALALLSTVLAAGAASSAPAGFFTGPAGRNIILPTGSNRILLGVAQTGTYASVARDVRLLEASTGRALDVEHLFMQGTCSLRLDALRAVVARGHVPLVSWLPVQANGGAILRGDSDGCIHAVGRQIARQRARIFLRPYWEFNGDWFAHSRDLDGSLLTPEEHLAMWRRTVDVLAAAGAFPKTSIVWCPAEGHYGNGDGFDERLAYPGDRYVDWVCADGYNWNRAESWCGAHGNPRQGWCEFAEIFHDRVAPGGNVEMDFRGRKPFMVGETGSAEGQHARKGLWFRNARDSILESMPGLRALVYFDMAYEATDWRISTSPSSLAGFAALARSPALRPGAPRR